MLRTYLESFATGLGYGLMFVAGLTAAIGILVFAVSWWWEKMKNLYGWPWLYDAIVAHKKTHPLPWEKKRDGKEGE